MQLTDAQFLELYKLALVEMMRRPTWPTRTPTQKQDRELPRPFVLACWAQAIARASRDVIEKPDEREEQPGNQAAASNLASDAPW